MIIQIVLSCIYKVTEYMAQQIVIPFAPCPRPNPQIFFPSITLPHHKLNLPASPSGKLKSSQPRLRISCHFIDDREKIVKRDYNSFSNVSFLVEISASTSASPIAQSKNEIRQFNSADSNPEEEKQNNTAIPPPPKPPKHRHGILTNMWWTNLKAAIGQRFNLEGIICCAKVITQTSNQALPHLTVPDIRSLDWSELHRRGFKGVVFDKDNTLTTPYVLTLWAPLRPSVERCKAIFGEDNVAVFSNSAGLDEFDPDGRKARALERKIGIKVIRHRVKKPAGNAEEIEKHFGCSGSKLVMVGDRCLTDIVYGNRNGFLTVWTKPLCSEEPLVVRQVRKLEEFLVDRWVRKGLKAPEHSLLDDGE